MNEQRFLFARPLFSTGDVFVTRAARELLQRVGVDANDLLVRHARGDWFDLSFDDQVRNVKAVAKGSRVFTSFPVGSPPNVERVFVITEYDRSSSTIVLETEYKWAALS